MGRSPPDNRAFDEPANGRPYGLPLAFKTAVSQALYVIVK